MAIGGFLGSALAGLTGYDRAQQEAQQNQYRQMQQRLVMQEMQQRQQQERQQQEAMRLAYGGLGGLGGLGGAPPLQQMPQTGGGQPPDMPRAGGDPTGGGPSPYSAWMGAPDPRGPGPGFPPINGRNMGGGLRAGGAIPSRGTPEREALKALIYADESGNRNVDQGVVPPGGGYNPSVGRVTGPSSASGYGQITDSTWRDTPTGRASGVTHAKNAPFEVQDKAVDDLIDKRGVQPWAPYNAKLREDLQKIAQGGQALSKQVAQDIPPMAQGRMGLAQMKEAIDKAAPDADGATKMMAIMELHKMLAPYEKLQLQQYMKDNQNEFRLELQRHQQEFQATERQEREKFQAGQKSDKFGKPTQIQVTKEDGKTENIEAQQGPGGQWVTADERRQPIDVSKGFRTMTASEAGGGRIAEAQFTRMLGATTQVAKAIGNLSAMPKGSTLGVFQGLQQERGSDLSEGMRRSLANEITPEATNMMSVITRGLARSLATLEAQGAATGLVGLSTQMTANLPAKGDTGLTALGKMADMRQITEAAIETLNASPRLSDKQKELLTKNLSRISDVVPFEVKDIIALQSAGADNPETYAQFARSVGLGGGESPNGGAATGRPAVGTVENGYRFKGGNPSDQSSWEKVE